MHREQEVILFKHVGVFGNVLWKAEAPAFNKFTIDLTESEAVERIKTKIDRELDKTPIVIDIPVNRSWPNVVQQPPNPTGQK